MNLSYWIAVSVLLALAFFIIIPPLWKKREIQEAESDQRNINIAKDRVNDLKQQLQAGALTQAQFDEQYAELELTLGDDLDIEQLNQKSSSQGRWVVPVLLIAIPLFSVLTYLQLGEPDALKKVQEVQQAQKQSSQSGLDVNAMVSGLAERLKQDPENAEGWLMLGRSYKYLEKYPLAVNAFEKAYALLGDEPEIMLQYADALAMANGGKLAGKPSELIFKALEKSPNALTGLWLAGMAKAENGEFNQAMQYWRKLEKILPPESDSLRELQGLMAAVQAQTTGSSGTVDTVSATVTTVSINVQVSVADFIKAKVAQTDTVFIYAKALTGPPMPLAIVRKQVSDLPLSVTLDDAMAMMPTMKLSKFKQVKIMARISKSGAAMQQKGDFIGSVELQELAGSTSVVIVISEEVK
ncbi:MAG: c-type cytochrome biogenesis protein CcmI [Methylococcales bacterium]|nr:c-type cytochrome biogenesis protein CcmI [Methylococcales bacterium]